MENYTKVSGLNGGDYTFNWVVESQADPTGCRAIDPVTIHDNSFVTYAHGNTPHAEVENCGTSMTLQALSTSGTGTWTDSKGNELSTTASETEMYISDVHKANATLYNIPTNGVTIYWKVVENSCSAEDFMVVSNVKPVANFVLTKENICDGTVTLNSQNTLIDGVVSGKWEKVSASASGNFTNYAANSDKASIEYTGINPQSTTDVKWTVTRKMTNGESCVSDPKILPLINRQFTFETNGDGNTNCNDTYTLIGTADGGVGTWSSNVTGITIEEHEAASSVKVVASGIKNDLSGNVFTWTVKNDYCPEEKTTVTEEFFVTQEGVFQTPVTEVECLYAPHYRANDSGSAPLTVEP